MRRGVTENLMSRSKIKVVAPMSPSVDRAPSPRRRGAESTMDPFKNVGQKGQSRRATLGNVLGWHWRGGLEVLFC